MLSRIERVRAVLAERDLPALLVSHPANIYYLAGFSGSSGVLLITADDIVLISDFRYTLQAAAEAPAWRFVQSIHPPLVAAREEIVALGLPRVGFDDADVSVAQFHILADDAPFALEPARGVVETLRLTKDADELDRIREAADITDAACARVLELARPGVTERELALAAEWYMRTHGAQAASFDIIVAAGPHSALPHAQPRDVALVAGDLVVVDLGARCRHYCGDLTRTFAVGHATDTAREIYRACLAAQLTGLTRIHAGMTGREADAVVRESIADAGYGDYFGHGTGHGVGVQIHEAPRLSRTSEEPLLAGMTVTVEPGIYLPDVGGVRIEDLVLVTETGVEVISAAPKPAELPVIG